MALDYFKLHLILSFILFCQVHVFNFFPVMNFISISTGFAHDILDVRCPDRTCLMLKCVFIYPLHFTSVSPIIVMSKLYFPISLFTLYRQWVASKRS